MAAVLPLAHKPQQGLGYCLPACTQMVLAYLGVARIRDALAKILALNPPFGTRHSNIKKLTAAGVKVTYESGDLADIQHWLEQETPVIVFVQAGDLPHWIGHQFQHAVVVGGQEAQSIYLMDPALESGPTPVDEAALRCLAHPHGRIPEDYSFAGCGSLTGLGRRLPRRPAGLSRRAEED